MRHGEAESQLTRDRDRQLTARGYADASAMLKQALPDLEKVQKILVSPYNRALQTADIAAELLPGRMVMTVEDLVPSANFMRLGAFIESLQLERVLVVSHQPLVGTFVDWLCGFEPGCYRMGTSSLAFIKTDIIAAGCGELQWLRQPGA